MKKTFRLLFLLGIMTCPFIFSACEKDHGEVDYNSVDDDDWKKKNAASVDNTGDVITTIDYSEIMK